MRCESPSRASGSVHLLSMSVQHGGLYQVDGRHRRERDSRARAKASVNASRGVPLRVNATRMLLLSSQLFSGGTVLRFDLERLIHILDGEQRRSPDPHCARA